MNCLHIVNDMYILNWSLCCVVSLYTEKVSMLCNTVCIKFLSMESSVCTPFVSVLSVCVFVCDKFVFML